MLKGKQCVPERIGGAGGGIGGTGGGIGGTGSGIGGTGGFSGGGSSAGGTPPGGDGGASGAMSSGGGSALGGSAGAGSTGGASSLGGHGGGELTGGTGGVAGAMAGSAGANSVAGQAGQAGEGGAEAGGSAQAGNAGQSAGGQASGGANTGGSSPDDVDDPCPDEPLDLNCDPACGVVSPQCSSIGCQAGTCQPTPMLEWKPSQKRLLIRTPPNPGIDPVCESTCTEKKSYKDITKNLIVIKGDKYPVKGFFYLFHHVSGGWTIDRSPGTSDCQCIGLYRPLPPTGECVFAPVSEAAGGSENSFINVYALKANARARNIAFERVTSYGDIPSGCSENKY